MPSLRPYQVEAAHQLVAALTTHGAALDASDCGTGKTYTACAVAQRLGLPVAIVCPKSIIPGWERVCREFGIQPLFILNYERLRMGKTEWLKKAVKTFHWQLPATSLIIFDEVHRCKSHESQNAEMLIAAWNNTAYHRVLMLSATAATTPLEMRALGYVLGLHKLTDFWKFAFAHGVRKIDRWRFAYVGGSEVLEKLHHQIFPNKGTRVRIKDLGDAFPENTIIAEAYDTGAARQINKAYEEVQTQIEKLRRLQALSQSELASITRARQIAELAKVPALAEMVCDLVDEGVSVVVFVNYTATLHALAGDGGEIICGDQTAEERQQAIEAFQSGEVSVLYCNLQAGGESISLHDLDGTRPRVSLISPSFSAIQLRQALGRIHRNGGKSKCIQKIVFAAGTIEDSIRQKVEKKVDCIDTLNDADLT